MADENEQTMSRRRLLRNAGVFGVALAGAGSLRSGNRALNALGVGPANALAAGTTTVTPSMTEGPYWIDEVLRRSDVRANTATASSEAGVVQKGVPLALTIKVLDADNNDQPVNGAHVDIWHANAVGLYSDEASQAASGGSSGASTAGQNFLRGYQVTGQDAGQSAAAVDGQVSFKTIWPGWYSGRAIHIHVRVRTYNSSGSVVENYTTQIFFSDANNDKVLEGAAPYNARSEVTDPTTDENDGVLTSSAFATNIVPVAGSISAGYSATFTIYLSAAQANNANSTGGGQGPGGAPGGGGPGGVTSDTTVSASLLSATVTKAGNGNRFVVLKVRASEQVTATAQASHGGKLLGKATGRLTAGTHTLKVAIGRVSSSETATVKVMLADQAGNTKTASRAVRI